MSHRRPISRRQTLQAFAAGAATLLGTGIHAQTPPWPDILARARGQKVFFNAWGGSERTNAYLQWAAGEVSRRHGITLQHVKITDTAEAVRRVRGEKQAGRERGGSVDMLWINGENFLTMKREGLLFGPFAERLPSYRWVDTEGKPTTRIDFSEPVAGMEAPWGMAQFTFFADRARVPEPPRSMAALLAFARAHPGRVSYPRPPNFHGTTFLKQALLEAVRDRAPLYRPYTEAAFAPATAPLWDYLDALHPQLWRGGRQFPQNAAAIRQMMADGELHIALTFNPNEAANEIAAGRLPATVVSWQNEAGSVGNTHFLAIPFNASAPEAAQVVIDFMLSPAAQARKADIAVWGDGTVLAVGRLPEPERALFARPPAPGQVQRPAPVILEPHGSWVDPLEREWLRRYAA
ncbi:ABC transporter substrate-binding protein [Ramlibacter rhizophilus]|uniref:ABC transporter substrate-binding protein n=1 Tax=Ramlibacter rhizophilus TaxID=1781167 RepID=A0A4Z0BFF3_9BURK|nr:ABC transporter substrate-binding protein [Ramlibacter rhizophilus]TFY97540.1 ABC transporter substrate-binding protein [Ramlibacter rhizophilus]